MTQEIAFILDRSGSMAGCETDTIGGYNSFLGKQQREEGSARVTTVLFDDHYELLHDAEDLQAIKPITPREYFVRGRTALLDAIGSTIVRVKVRAEKAIFVIITDGHENASVSYRYGEVKEMIAERQRAGWEFFFLGANLTNFEDADRLGIRQDRRTTFAKDHMMHAYAQMSQNVSEYRKGKQMPEDWDQGMKGEGHRVAGVADTVSLTDIHNYCRCMTVESLYGDRCANVPQQGGIYFVCVPEGFTVTILEHTTAITEHGGDTLLYAAGMLREKYQRGDKRILYIGKGDVLNMRIRQLVRYAYGEVNNHRGGRALWQVEGNKQLVVGWFACEDAAAWESNLLHQYQAAHCTLPLANHQLPGAQRQR